MQVSSIKIRDIAQISNTSLPLVSRNLKKYDNSEVIKVNNRIIGVSPEAAEKYLRSVGIDSFYRPAILLSANLCGGVGKTTSIHNLGACLRRITNRKTPIVYIDGDSQGSFTSTIFGKPADDKEPILIDFLEGKARIEDILVKVNDDNVWFIKSNLNQAWIDRVLKKPQDIKNSMLNVYNKIFEVLGSDAKIFQDHTPQISALFASSVCALNQLPKNILKAIIIPIRSDTFAIQGAEYILKEISELHETFGSSHDTDIHCFFSNIDKRIPSSTSEALRLASSKEQIQKHLSSVAIRYCSEVPKNIMSSDNVYSSGKNNNAAQDFQDLLSYIFSSKKHLE